MTMAVENLSGADREGMVLHMKKAMAGTFFERWLSMSGWQGGQNGGEGDSKPAALPATKKDGDGKAPTVVTNTAELEKLIRAVMRNGDLTPFQKDTTIQGLRAVIVG